MGTKICPICDSPVNGINFCKTCKRFVTPIENNHTFYLNERRSDVDYQRDYHFDGDAYDYSAEKIRVEDSVSDCHDEFDEKVETDWQKEEEKYFKTEQQDWQGSLSGTEWGTKPYPVKKDKNNPEKKKKGGVLAIIIAIIGICCQLIPDLLDNKDDSYDIDTEDAYESEDSDYNTEDTGIETDQTLGADASLSGPDGYLYYEVPGQESELEGYRTLSAEEAEADGSECTMSGHYSGVTMDEFETAMLEQAQNAGIDLQEDDYGRYLGLYRYEDGDTNYEKRNTFYADMGFLYVAVYGDYNSDRIHSMMICQKIQDGNDYYRMDEMYDIIAESLSEPDLQSKNGYDSIIEALHTLRDQDEDMDADSTRVYIGEWEITVSRLNGYLYLDLYVEK